MIYISLVHEPIPVDKLNKSGSRRIVPNRILSFPAILIRRYLVQMSSFNSNNLQESLSSSVVSSQQSQPQTDRETGADC